MKKLFFIFFMVSLLEAMESGSLAPKNQAMSEQTPLLKSDDLLYQFNQRRETVETLAKVLNENITGLLISNTNPWNDCPIVKIKQGKKTEVQSALLNLNVLYLQEQRENHKYLQEEIAKQAEANNEKYWFFAIFCNLGLVESNLPSQAIKVSAFQENLFKRIKNENNFSGLYDNRTFLYTLATKGNVGPRDSRNSFSISDIIQKAQISN